MLRLADYEKWAQENLRKSTWEYYRGGTEDGSTYADNFAALKRYRLVPRLLRDVSSADASTTVLGHRVSFPVCVGPTADHRRAHGDGEPGTARGTERAQTIFTLSTFSNTSLEDVAAAAPSCIKFFNLYIYSKRELIVELVGRAERAGYQALVLTADSPSCGPLMGKRRELCLDYLKAEPWEMRLLVKKSENLRPEEQYHFVLSLLNASATWADVAWLRTITRLPIIVKGVLSGEEAELAVKAGAAGILVSNHGGRQLDSTPATIDVLREVVLAVAGRAEVYMDGGVRHGTDVLKALALGARAVFVGRPAVFALAYKGEDGVAEMLEILKAEFLAAMAIAGCANVSEINPSLIRHQSQFPSKI